MTSEISHSFLPRCNCVYDEGCGCVEVKHLSATDIKQDLPIPRRYNPNCFCHPVHAFFSHFDELIGPYWQSTLSLCSPNCERKL